MVLYDAVLFWFWLLIYWLVGVLDLVSINLIVWLLNALVLGLMLYLVILLSWFWVCGAGVGCLVWVVFLWISSLLDCGVCDWLVGKLVLVVFALL